MKYYNLIKLLVVGFSAITTFCLMFYFAPWTVVFALFLMIITLLSFAVGYIIVDTYEQWRKDNDKNKSRKKAPPSKDDQ